MNYDCIVTQDKG